MLTASSETSQPTIEPVAVEPRSTTSPPDSTGASVPPATVSPVPTTVSPSATTITPMLATARIESPATTSPTTVSPTLVESPSRDVSIEPSISTAPATTPPAMVATVSSTPVVNQTTFSPTAAPAVGASSANNGAVLNSATSDHNTFIFIAGAAAAWLNVVLIVALLLLYRRHRRFVNAQTPRDDRDGADPDQHRTPHAAFANIDGVTDGLPSMAIPTLPKDFRKNPTLQSVRLPLDQICLGELLSRGAFGEVFMVTYQSKTVVIKQLLRERRLDMTEARLFAQEIQLMATLRHPRIVKLVGAAWDAPAALIALHIAEALEYLHTRSPTIIHRDLKSKNVVLSRVGDAKLTDFGVSRARCESTMTSAVGSSLWMAPEVIAGGRYDEKADIFSFGALLAELDTQMLPYRYGADSGRNFSEVVLLHQVETGAVTVAFTGREDDMMTITGRSCVALNPLDRPTAAAVRARIKSLLRPRGE